MQLGELEVALDIAESADSEGKWRQLSELAMSTGKLEVSPRHTPAQLQGAGCLPLGKGSWGIETQCTPCWMLELQGVSPLGWGKAVGPADCRHLVHMRAAGTTWGLCAHAGLMWCRCVWFLPQAATNSTVWQPDSANATRAGAVPRVKDCARLYQELERKGPACQPSLLSPIKPEVLCPPLPAGGGKVPAAC